MGGPLSVIAETKAFIHRSNTAKSLMNVLSNKSVQKTQQTGISSDIDVSTQYRMQESTAKKYEEERGRN